MKILIFAILLIFTLFVPYSAFAQEQTVMPPFEIYGGDSDACMYKHVTINTPTYLDPNYTRSTIIDYDGTKLIATLYLGNANYTGIHQHVVVDPVYIHSLMNTTFNKILPLKQITTSEFNSNINLGIALTNAGNKTVTIAGPFADFGMLVINNKNGNSIYYPDDYFPHVPYQDVYSHILGEPIDLNTIFSDQLRPGESMLTYISPEKKSTEPYYVDGERSENPDFVPISQGNYTITGVARFLGDVDGPCTLVYLWSQPVDLVTISQSNVPEFPFAVPILLIGVISVIVLYRLKSG